MGPPDRQRHLGRTDIICVSQDATQMDLVECLAKWKDALTRPSQGKFAPDVKQLMVMLDTVPVKRVPFSLSNNAYIPPRDPWQFFFDPCTH